MEAIRAYYNGKAFIPVAPVRAKENQAAIITILDEFRDETSREESIQILKSLRGIAKGKGITLKDFIAQKAYEKSLER